MRLFSCLQTSIDLILFFLLISPAYAADLIKITTCDKVEVVIPTNSALVEFLAEQEQSKPAAFMSSSSSNKTEFDEFFFVPTKEQTPPDDMLDGFEIIDRHATANDATDFDAADFVVVGSLPEAIKNAVATQLAQLTSRELDVLARNARAIKIAQRTLRMAASRRVRRTNETQCFMDYNAPVLVGIDGRAIKVNDATYLFNACNKVNHPIVFQELTDWLIDYFNKPECLENPNLQALITTIALHHPQLFCTLDAMNEDLLSTTTTSTTTLFDNDNDDDDDSATPMFSQASPCLSSLSGDGCFALSSTPHHTVKFFRYHPSMHSWENNYVVMPQGPIIPFRLELSRGNILIYCSQEENHLCLVYADDNIMTPRLIISVPSDHHEEIRPCKIMPTTSNKALGIFSNGLQLFDCALTEPQIIADPRIFYAFLNDNGSILLTTTADDIVIYDTSNQTLTRKQSLIENFLQSICNEDATTLAFLSRFGTIHCYTRNQGSSLFHPKFSVSCTPPTKSPLLQKLLFISQDSSFIVVQGTERSNKKKLSIINMLTGTKTDLDELEMDTLIPSAHIPVFQDVDGITAFASLLAENSRSLTVPLSAKQPYTIGASAFEHRNLIVSTLSSNGELQTYQKCPESIATVHELVVHIAQLKRAAARQRP